MATFEELLVVELPADVVGVDDRVLVDTAALLATATEPTSCLRLEDGNLRMMHEPCRASSNCSRLVKRRMDEPTGQIYGCITVAMRGFACNYGFREVCFMIVFSKGSVAFWISFSSH